jgi:predicted AlkP superfamily pyrophosphatase or phosphodiesterase
LESCRDIALPRAVMENGLSLQPVCLLNVVGLTQRHIGPHTPSLSATASEGLIASLSDVIPAVTCSVQATMLTGEMPSVHGIVGNGWYWRDMGEVRFWLQSNKLIEAETVYAAARRLAAERGEAFSCAKLFWWFNQGAPVDWSVTPKPHYGADGSKVFGIHGKPDDLAQNLERELGPFPFHSFWGPKAGLPCSEWIARAAASVLKRQKPTLTMLYLPHLDYDLQRYGPDASIVPSRLREVDACVEVVKRAARDIGAQTVIVSEYGLVPVRRAINVNRSLREAGWLNVRPGPFGEMLDTFNSKAFAVCDHQVAHVYVSDTTEIPAVRDHLKQLSGVTEVLDREAQREFELQHPRSGDLVLLADPDAWFAYPYWAEDAAAPDFARTVDIHRKPGYDPCELFIDPSLRMPLLHVGWRLLQKSFGLRYKMDVVPLDTTLVRGSHGLPSADSKDGPVVIADHANGAPLPHKMTEIKRWLLQSMGLG